MPFLPPVPDIPVAQLTLAGRSLLARSILARGRTSLSQPEKSLVTFKLKGFVVGSGGYSLSNPLQITPIVDDSDFSISSVAILDNRFDPNDSLIINGVVFPVGIEIVLQSFATGGQLDNGFGQGVLFVTPGSLAPNAHVGQRLRLIDGTGTNQEEVIQSNTANEIVVSVPWIVAPDNTTEFQILTNSPGESTWVPGTTKAATAANLASVINSSNAPAIKNIVRAKAVGEIVELTILVYGAIGNLIPITESDAGGLAINNFSVVPSGGFFAGGSYPAIESSEFPPTSPNTEPFFDIEKPNASATSLVCRVPTGVGNAGLGEIGIYVQVLDSSIPAEIGNIVLYAVSHFPIVAKHSNSVYVTRVITQY